MFSSKVRILEMTPFKKYILRLLRTPLLSLRIRYIVTAKVLKHRLTDKRSWSFWNNGQMGVSYWWLWTSKERSLLMLVCKTGF